MNNDGFATRFVSLSSMPNPSSKTTFKDKYVHALNIKPLIHCTSDELREAEFKDIVDQDKIPPAMRNPFIPPKGGDTDNYLLQEKIQLGMKLMEEKKIKNEDNEEDSEDVEEEVRNGKLNH